MLVNRSEISRYLPQKEPFIAIHELLEVREGFAMTQFEVSVESIFVTDGLFLEPGLIENIAQTAAVLTGYFCQKEGWPIPLGYIAGIKNLSIFSLPVIGSILNTSVQVTNLVMGVTLLDGLIRVKESIVCQCEMRVFLDPGTGFTS